MGKASARIEHGVGCGSGSAGLVWGNLFLDSLAYPSILSPTVNSFGWNGGSALHCAQLRLRCAHDTDPKFQV